ncbi:MAG: N-acetylmuramoyl-L-alanine amidase [Acidobacteriaceae bacterium]
MNASSNPAVFLLAALATATVVVLLGKAQPQLSTARTPPPGNAINRELIFLDPAHGGADAGSNLGGQTLEKDVTLAFAARLGTALTSAGFTVLSSRDSDLPALLTADQRAEIANRAHPVACIVLHATATGSGVHLYTSTLQPSELKAPDSQYDAPAFAPTPWDNAQAASVTQSHALAASLTAALAKSDLPALSGDAPLRPLDSLACPAVAIELAPLLVGGADPTPVIDAGYQQRVATVVAAALRAHQDQANAAANPSRGPTS